MKEIKKMKLVKTEDINNDLGDCVKYFSYKDFYDFQKDFDDSNSEYYKNHPECLKDSKNSEKFKWFGIYKNHSPVTLDGISDLFPNLERFSFSCQQGFSEEDSKDNIEGIQLAIDVSPLGKCKNLKEIEFHCVNFCFIRRLENIPQLEHLIIIDAPSFDHLDIKQNKNLKTLSLEKEQFLYTNIWLSPSQK